MAGWCQFGSGFNWPMVLVLWTGVFMLASGCGYSTNPLEYEGVETIAVPVFENKTLWRGHEFVLTQVVCQQIRQFTGYRLVDRPQEADLVLEGEIVDYRLPVSVEDRDDRAVESQVAMTLRLRVRNNRVGKQLFCRQRTVVAEFSGLRGESELTARNECISKLARWVVSCLQKGW
jgi:hypothetical protein